MILKISASLYKLFFTTNLYYSDNLSSLKKKNTK